MTADDRQPAEDDLQPAPRSTAKWFAVLKWAAMSCAVVAVAVGAVLVIQKDWGPRGPIILIPADAPKHGLMGVELDTDRLSPTVKFVTQGSSADQAGIQPGDEIVSIGDVASPTVEDFHRVMRETVPDSTVSVTLRRDDMEHVVDVLLMSYTDLAILRQDEIR